MKNWEVWAEGYTVTGGRSDAFLLGTALAPTFDDAVSGISNRLEMKPYKSGGQWIYWGCRLFDNEADARRSFG